MEDRFWVWVHYGATKIARGELFEALDFLSFMRSTAIASVASLVANRPARGVRHLERDLPELGRALRDTVAAYERASIVDSLRAMVRIYLELRERAPTDLILRGEAQTAAIAALDALS